MVADEHEMTEEDEASDGRLRPAMLDDGQPRLPWWLPLPGLALAVLWVAYVAAAGDGTVLLVQTLVWPGSAIFVVTTVTTYFGWRLDLD